MEVAAAAAATGARVLSAPPERERYAVHLIEHRERYSDLRSAIFLTPMQRL